MKFTARIFFFSLFSMIMLAAYAEAARVRVAIPSTTHAVLAFTTTRDKGYYREEGLDVELILMSAPIASRALLGGDVEVATVGGAGLPPVLSGAPLRFVFTTYSRPMFWLFGKSEIRSVKELKGKKVGVSGIGSGPDSLLREALRRNGLEGGRDVLILSLGVMPTIYSGLQGGVVDAAMLSPPFTFRAEENGFREIIALPNRTLWSYRAAYSSKKGFCDPIRLLWKSSFAPPLRVFCISSGTVRERFPFLRDTCKLMAISRPRPMIKWCGRP